jgi:hypothetical protein
MTPEQASRMLEQLALGCDPRTGEPLPDEDPCMFPEVIRALFLAQKALLGQLEERKPAARRAPVMRNGILVENAGKKWSGDDADTALREFESGTPIGAIATQLGRTDGSIVARLVQAGAIPDREAGFALVRSWRDQANRSQPR